MIIGRSNVAGTLGLTTALKHILLRTGTIKRCIQLLAVSRTQKCHLYLLVQSGPMILNSCPQSPFLKTMAVKEILPDFISILTLVRMARSTSKIVWRCKQNIVRKEEPSNHILSWSLRAISLSSMRMMFSEARVKQSLAPTKMTSQVPADASATT